MAVSSSPQVTRWLLAWRQGDEAALERLVPVVYQELRRLARHYMAGQRPSHTLQPTALINEVYMRLVDCQLVNWQNRAHFIAVSGNLMRRVLVDHARSKQYQKRGGGAVQVSLDEGLLPSAEPGRDLIALDDALKALAELDARKSKVVELRFFGGLTTQETAEVLNVSQDTVVRDWRFAKAWLQNEMTKSEPRL
jgi:RNA polymerase sigma factor (TIGR02999 family)